MNPEVNIVPYYSNKAHLYQENRWHFDRRAAANLLARIDLDANGVVADIGAGTGMSSLPFLQEGLMVYGIEPNASMRRTAEQVLKKFSNYQSVDGTAEESDLPDGSIDLIVVGRAMHWFDQEKSKREFARIRKPDGWLAIMAVKNKDLELRDAVRSINKAKVGWREEAGKYNRIVKPLEFFFDNAGFKEISSVQSKKETWPQFWGRMQTFAGAPLPESDDFERYEEEIHVIFEKFQRDGEIAIEISTEIKYGHPG